MPAERCVFWRHPRPKSGATKWQCVKGYGHYGVHEDETGSVFR